MASRQIKLSDAVEDFLNKMQEQLKASGMTMSELSRKTGIARPHLYRLIDGTNTPTLRNAEAIADALGLQIIVRKAKRSA